MIPALLHGKSGPEDSLTSTVFGVLSTLPTAIGLGPWFSTAFPFDPGAERLPSLSDDYRVLYWPSLRYGEARVQPDLILETGTTRLVIKISMNGMSEIPDSSPSSRGFAKLKATAMFQSNLAPKSTIARYSNISSMRRPVVRTRR